MEVIPFAAGGKVSRLYSPNPRGLTVRRAHVCYQNAHSNAYVVRLCTHMCALFPTVNFHHQSGVTLRVTFRRKERVWNRTNNIVILSFACRFRSGVGAKFTSTTKRTDWETEINSYWRFSSGFVYGNKSFDFYTLTRECVRWK